MDKKKELQLEMFLAKVSIPSLKKVQGCKHNAENLISWNGMNTNFHVIMPFSYHVLCISPNIKECCSTAC